MIASAKSCVVDLALLNLAILKLTTSRSGGERTLSVGSYIESCVEMYIVLIV